MTPSDISKNPHKREKPVIEQLRDIRDSLNRQLATMTTEERREFFKKQALLR